MSLRLVDCRPRAAYEAGHLPGAVHLDPETQLSTPTADPSVGGRHPLPDPLALGAVLSAAGIGPGSFVLALDEGTGWAARCWWLLRHLGHDAAGTLDARAYAGPLETEDPRVERAAFVPHVRDDDTIEAEEIRGAARRPDPPAPRRARAGALARRRRAARPRRRTDPGRAERLLRGASPRLARRNRAEIAVYCGSGVSAAPVVQRLVLAGRDDVRLYPGSFSEWCRNPSNPIERGDPA